MSLKCVNKSYTIIRAYAPVIHDNKWDKEGVKKYWDELDKTMRKISKGDVKVLLGDFIAQLGREKWYEGS